MNEFNTDYMRVEIAVLQEDVYSHKPGVAKFKIPVLMTDDTSAVVSVNNNNLLNRRNGTLNNATLTIDDTIDLFIPTQHTIFCGSYVVPAGTKFLVSFVGGNPNDARIIGMYDYENLHSEEVSYNGIIGQYNE